MYYIYCINLINQDRFYVGLTDNPSNRFKFHMSRLTRQKHHCKDFQEAFNTHGMVGMGFQILSEHASFEEASAEENKCISEFTCYNTTKINTFTIHSGKREILHLNSGKKYKSISEAAFELGLHSEGIQDVCAGRREHLSQHRFEYCKQLPSMYTNYNQSNSKKVVRGDGVIFESIAAAARSCGGKTDSIRECCNGCARTYKSHTWTWG